MFRTLNRSNAPDLFAELDSSALQGSLPFVADIAKKNALTAADLTMLLKFRTENGASALHLACFRSAAELTQLILKQADQAWLQDISKHVFTPLYYATTGEFSDNNKDAERLKHENLRIPIITLLLENTLLREQLNRASKSGTTPLHLAAEKGYSLITGMLLAAGANAKALNNNNNLPLHLAINRQGNITEQNLILIGMLADAAEEYVNNTNKEGNSPLKIALLNSRYDIISTLLMHGASASIKSLIGSDSFMKDHIDEAINMFETMLQKNNGAKEAACLNHVLEVSSSSTRKAFFTQLIQSLLGCVKQASALKNEDFNAQEMLIQQTLLSLVIAAIPAGKNHLYQDEFTDCFFNIVSNDKKTVHDRELLLQLATDPDEVNAGLTVLQDKVSVSRYHDKINAATKALNEEKTVRFPLHDAITKGEGDALVELIHQIPAESRDEFINKKRTIDNHTALSLAVSLSQWQDVFTLLQEGADPTLAKKLEENRDQNIIHCMINDAAAQKLETPLLIQLLTVLKAGVLLPHLMQAESKTEGTPIESAIKTHDTEIVTTLLMQSGDLNAFLQAAIKFGLPAMLKEIAGSIPRGKSIDEYLSEDGFTLLQSAANAGKASHLAALVQLHADVNRMTAASESVLHLSAKIPSAESIKVLLDNGANALIVNKAGKTFLEVMIEGSDIKSVVAQLKTSLYPAEEKREGQTLLTHLLAYYSKKQSLPEEKYFNVNLSAIASLDLENFYKAFKLISNQLRAASNSGKISSAEKLALLIQHRQLCQLVQNIKPAFESFRKVKYHGLFQKSNVTEKLESEQKALSKKIETLDRMIQKTGTKGVSSKKFH